MNHIPRPKKPRPSATVEVHLMSDDNYDGDNFVTYPNKKLGIKTVLQWNELFEKKPEKFLRFLETWSYFGYLSTVICRPVKTSDFISCPSKLVLTTERLPKYLECWIEGLKKDTRLEVDVLTRNMNYGIEIHKAFLGANHGNPQRDNELKHKESLYQYMQYTRIPKDVRSPEFTMAMSVLVESVCASFAASIPPNRLPPWLVGGLRGSEKWKSKAWKLLQEDGWCPRDLVSLFNRLNTSCLYFLHRVERPGINLSHHCARIRKEEDLKQRGQHCSQFSCSKLLLDEKTYETKHTEQGCKCAEAEVDSEELYSILRHGGIPLIKSVEDGFTGTQIDLVEAKENSKYIAISHVWSDGLGNLDKNAIPRCQLVQLSRFIRALPKKHRGINLFWFDTICVPPDKLDQKACQDQAIGKMRNVYENAAAVLVLDSWLRLTASRKMAPEEIYLRILSSIWNTRLWTFQEVALAKCAYFRLCDGFYDLDLRMKQISKESDFATSITILPVLHEYHFATRAFLEFDLNDRLIAISGVLSDRTTSQLSDEAICIAVLLGLDVEEVASTPKESRMARLWRMIPTVPDDILYCDLETLSDEGLHWAPKSFLRSTWNWAVAKSGTPDTGKIGVLNEARGISVLSIGVHVQARGLVFCSADSRLSKTIFIFDDGEGSWHALDISHRINNDARGYDKDEYGTPRAYFINPYQEYGAKVIAFVRNELAGEDQFDKAPTNTGVETGCLVAVDSERYGIIFARKICSAKTHRVPDHDWEQIKYLNDMKDKARMQFLRGHVRRDRHGLSVLGCLVGRRTERRQQWIIG